MSHARQSGHSNAVAGTHILFCYRSASDIVRGAEKDHQTGQK